MFTPMNSSSIDEICDFFEPGFAWMVKARCVPLSTTLDGVFAAAGLGAAFCERGEPSPPHHHRRRTGAGRFFCIGCGREANERTARIDCGDTPPPPRAACYN